VPTATTAVKPCRRQPLWLGTWNPTTPYRVEIFAIIKYDTLGFGEREALGRDSMIWKIRERLADKIDSKS
jgi:hypothetical protein